MLTARVLMETDALRLEIELRLEELQEQFTGGAVIGTKVRVLWLDYLGTYLLKQGT